MEFSYRISEADYLLACKAKIAAATNRRLRLTKHAYRLLLFLFVLATLVLGLMLGWKDSVNALPGLSKVLVTKALPEAIIPALAITCLYFSALGFLHRFLVAGAQQERYRSDSSCHCETVLTVDQDHVNFQCANGCLTMSGWNIYRQWIESGNIILLVTLSGVRRIVNVGGLSQTQRDELRGILASALPKK